MEMIYIKAQGVPVKQGSAEVSKCDDSSIFCILISSFCIFSFCLLSLSLWHLSLVKYRFSMSSNFNETRLVGSFFFLHIRIKDENNFHRFLKWVVFQRLRKSRRRPLFSSIISFNIFKEGHPSAMKLISKGLST